MAGAGQAVSAVSKQVAKETGKEAAKEGAKEAAKHAATESAKTAGKEVTSQGAKTAGKEFASQGVKTTGSELTSQAGKNSVNEAGSALESATKSTSNPTEYGANQFQDSVNQTKNEIASEIDNANQMDAVKKQEMQNQVDDIAEIEEAEAKEKDAADQANKEQQEEIDKKQKEAKEPGKEMNKDGEVEDSSTKKTLKAAGRVAAAYFTKGESLGADKELLKIPQVDKALGVVSKGLEKQPGVKAASKVLDKTGADDLVNDALDTAGGAINAAESFAKGDIQEGLKQAEEMKKSAEKLNKNKLFKFSKFTTWAPIIGPILLFIFLAIIVVGIAGGVLGGFLDIVEDVVEVVEGAGEAIGDAAGAVYDSFTSTPAVEEALTGDVQSIPGWENLNVTTQNMLTAASLAAAVKVPYQLGNHPGGSGLGGIPNTGLDCAGYIQWIIWTATGQNPGTLTTQEITNRIGTDFIEISASELRPGDIGLRRKGGSNLQRSDYNHTGMYAGDGYWYHESSKGAVKAKYSGFTVFLRYKGAA